MAFAPSKSHPRITNGPGNKVTPQQWGKFLSMLAQTANLLKSAEYAGISTSIVYKRRKSDPEFKEQYDEAWQAGYEILEGECARRAFEGYDQPVFQQGMQVGVIRQYSDALAMFLMKGNKPMKFKDRASSEVSINGPDGGPVQTTLTHDLSKLGLEQLMALKSILKDAAVDDADTK